MPIVSEVVTHVLEHVLAESSSTDESQADGMEARSDYAVDAIDIFLDDARELDKELLLRELALSGKPGRLRGSWRRLLKNAETDTRPRLAIQNWVGKAEEERG